MSWPLCEVLKVNMVSACSELDSEAQNEVPAYISLPWELARNANLGSTLGHLNRKQVLRGL